VRKGHQVHVRECHHEHSTNDHHENKTGAKEHTKVFMHDLVMCEVYTYIPWDDLHKRKHLKYIRCQIMCYSLITPECKLKHSTYI
jgi:hypothetical protein